MITALVFTLLLFADHSFAFGKTLLLAPPSTPASEYEAALQTYPMAISPVELHIQSNPSSASTQALIEEFSTAEQIFLDHQSPAVAMATYKNLLLKENLSDWKEDHRRLFLISYLRLLQLSEDDPSSAEKNLWKRRVQFYLSHIDAPTDLVPPPILRSLEEEHKLAANIEFHIPQHIQKDFPIVLVNGRSYSSKMRFSLPKNSGPFRFTFLSPFYEAQIITTTPEKQSWKVEKKPFVSDRCAEGKTSESQGDIQVKIYIPLDCNSPKINSAKELPLPSTGSKDLSWKMTKTHWVWVGLGVVGAAVMVHHLKKDNHRDNKPGESYGF